MTNTRYKMLEILGYGFMQRALVAGILVSVACSLLGVFLVLKKSAFIGEGLAHISFAGIAIGLIFGFSPLIASVILTVIGGIAIMKLTAKSRLHTDAAIGIISYTGLAFGVFLISISRGFTIDIFSYLFGNILTISQFDMYFSAGLAVAVLFFTILFFNELYVITFSEETAKTTGINVNLLNYVFAVLVAITVVISIRVVGILLVASFMILPASAALQLAKGFRHSLVISAVFGILSVIGGLSLSYFLDVAAGATIVLLNFGFFMLSMVLRKSAY
jgi:zinc transport system permease protein